VTTRDTRDLRAEQTLEVVKAELARALNQLHLERMEYRRRWTPPGVRDLLTSLNLRLAQGHLNPSDTDTKQIAQAYLDTAYKAGRADALAALSEPTCLEAQHGGHPTCPHQEQALHDLRTIRAASEARLRALVSWATKIKLGEPLETDEDTKALSEAKAFLAQPWGHVTGYER
jgi:hypothetical protein